MKAGVLVNAAVLIRDVILSPRRLFENIREGGLASETYVVFFLAALITFAKSFLITRPTFVFSFFNNDLLNQAVFWLNNVRVSWLAAYVCYFTFIFIVFLFCRFFNKQVRYKHVAVSLMAISGLGVTMQLVFFLLSFAASRALLLVCSYLVYAWVVFLSIWAIKITQRLSLSQAVISFLVPALPFALVVFIVGLSPYLAWLTF